MTPAPLVLLSAMAGATRRIRLVTSVLAAALHDPVLLAHQTAPRPALPTAGSEAPRNFCRPARGRRREFPDSGAVHAMV
ncbi:LLM class flavin-dependent oxidoreductase [Streptomyces sp. NPDC007856]|uniref:LLM class flavin-dependent oxidoreductase n=1 Tax=Streptomyces sp. NPDC007856 TaxID=3364781 RepID=UPI00368D6776